MPEDTTDFVQVNAKQAASRLLRAIAASRGVDAAEIYRWRIDARQLHFHDTSTTEIVWNDVQAILAYNEHTGADLPVPLVATEAMNVHRHTSEYDGGYTGARVHNHANNNEGGFAFSCFSPGTSIPQQVG